MTSTKRQRGRHKIFIGMAPGVGKTYRMLLEGRAARREGIDVMVGLLETHGRLETIKASEGLDLIPRKRIRYQDVDLDEMDVEAILHRVPQLVLVDELAHTNVPGSQREKRWEDVEHLLVAGVDVYSTLNIQHIESLNDVVAQITGVVVRERVPNHVLINADEVVLVDVTPETLQSRLKDGKVYAKEKVEQALVSFFQRQHLVSLRELALRHVADRVNDEAALKPVRERMMVCLTVAPVERSKPLLRRASRLALAMDAELTVLTVHDPNRFLSRDELLLIAECQQLCLDVGGTYLEEESTDSLATIVRIACQRQITQIVLSQARRSRRKTLFGYSFSERLQHKLLRENVDIYLVADDAPTQA
jgi:two-component system, OmpR family, sensor histidine kinase KdpD